ncbi:MAG: GNAT family N-acetyltransferase [Bdellovibrionales bacterium]|nr:GNAT family N-acetyltransferase [Bdellovibrionales bacterium]
MKLYRHYKNKPYKYIGTAKHSETLQDMVIYETHYENDLGRLWVRPKDMFFESVNVGDVVTPRFYKVPLKIEATTEVNESAINLIAPLINESFGKWDKDWFYSTFNEHEKFYLAMAYIDEQIVGFKLGYERTAHEFYSWLGAVSPHFRGLGVAADLMRSQHEWCRKQGYKKVATKTQPHSREMLLLNISNDFQIVGTEPYGKDGLKIQLEKIL